MEKFFVIEGLDGSGKTTQLELLRQHLRKQGKAFQDIHFPKLNQGVFGNMIAQFLRGEFGGLNEVHPQLVALLFAADRHEHAKTLENWLHDGQILIADRYVNSNIAFQCAKLNDESEKTALREWILNIEYSYYKIPRPVVSLYLDVPFKAVQKSLSKEREGKDRDYLNGKKDIHEADLNFQEKVRQEYLKMVKNQVDFHLIQCTDDQGNFLPPDKIHHKILEFLSLKN